MECQSIFIKMKSHRPPGVQINVVCISRCSFSAAPSRASAGYSVGTSRGWCETPETPLEKSDYYERIRCGAGVLHRSDLDPKGLKLQSCMDIAES